jgi:TM2 domain-containing membrane protein YozV
MAQIIDINDNIVKIGVEDGSLLEVERSKFTFEPVVGAYVNIFKNETDVSVAPGQAPIQPAPASSSGVSFDTAQLADGTIVKTMNKHLFVWVFNFLLGGIGIDRFMRGQTGLGVAKLLLNWATCGIWCIVDWIIAITKAYSSTYPGDDISFYNGKYAV